MCGLLNNSAEKLLEMALLGSKNREELSLNPGPAFLDKSKGK
jgi:hypothetical protein